MGAPMLDGLNAQVAAAEKRDRSLWIWINSKERRNEINPAVIAGTQGTLGAAICDASTRANILSKVDEKAFSADADLSREAGVFTDRHDEPTIEMPLLRTTLARSGGKGNVSNIAIVACKPEYLSVPRQALTPARMAAFFVFLVRGLIKRYEAPGTNAVDFLLSDALCGGGMASRRINPLGTAYGQMVL